MKKLTALLLCCLVLAGCAPSNISGTPAETQMPTQTSPLQTESPTVPETSAPEVTEPAPTVNGKPRLTVYTIDDQLENFQETTVEVDEITEDVILAQLTAAGVLNADVKINSLVHQSDALMIDFNSAFADVVCSTGSTGEWVIMGSVVNTFLTAYGADSVFITVDGNILESGHVIYDMALEFYH